ncbi:hypothetical protein [Vibrio sp. ER1A]|uniref:hypothetical protein n=1 Tax=Vibrio sp. ER1A TaxID=1517681 RepID=UPI0004DD64E3|nr:hypothetical protein [Vibrio sp. ER1A]KFA99450.1 hypothetical protein HW45_03555 [Vibrio sp. ER1A]
MEITTLKQAATHLIESGVVDMETMQVEGKQLLEVCGLSLAAPAREIRRQIVKHGFVENEDFKALTLESSGGRPGTVYQFSMNAANHVLLAAMTKEGKAARQDAIETKTEQQGQFEHFSDDPIISLMNSMAAQRRIQLEQQAEINNRFEEVDNKINQLTEGAPIGWMVLTRIGEHYGFSKQKSKEIAAAYELITRPMSIGEYGTITRIVKESDFKQALAQEMKATKLNGNWFKSSKLGRYAAKGRFHEQYMKKMLQNEA